MRSSSKFLILLVFSLRCTLTLPACCCCCRLPCGCLCCCTLKNNNGCCVLLCQLLHGDPASAVMCCCSTIMSACASYDACDLLLGETRVSWIQDLLFIGCLNCRSWRRIAGMCNGLRLYLRLLLL